MPPLVKPTGLARAPARIAFALRLNVLGHFHQFPGHVAGFFRLHRESQTAKDYRQAVAPFDDAEFRAWLLADLVLNDRFCHRVSSHQYGRSTIASPWNSSSSRSKFGGGLVLGQADCRHDDDTA